ncbi:MAG: hypothetical protein F4W68_07235 [Cenarchaeum sp. SB0661_bin_35]|nr:hypothetical protein [Cenarchaeum sp. SB0667_bin_13]MYC80268.1 hypothetical protein [Cenarchaeum sp. SB0661_bin_35]
MALNRFRWANRLGILIPSYGVLPEVVYTITLPINILPVGLTHQPCRDPHNIVLRLQTRLQKGAATAAVLPNRT